MTDKLSEKEIVDFYRSNITRLYKFFYFKTLSKEVAEDLSSETFINFVKIIKDQREIENLQSFLYGIAKNVFLRYLKEKYQTGIPFSEFERDFDNYAEEFVRKIENKNTLEERAIQFISLLPPRQKTILELRFVQKLSLREICIKLNKDMNYVKTTQKRGIANLKRYVELGEIQKDVH